LIAGDLFFMEIYIGNFYAYIFFISKFIFCGAFALISFLSNFDGFDS